jgi:nucleotide-binding universal stress UspA family protein
MFRKILTANDGSQNAFKGLDAPADIAAKYGADLHVILVEEIEPRNGTIEEIDRRKEREDRLLHRHLKHIEAAAAQRGVAVQPHAFIGHPVRTIVAFAKDNGFDLLVIGATGHSEFYEMLLGGRADRILRLAHCPVLVVK